MANKFIDPNGLLYLWQKILGKFVAKEDGKGLSTNDYTTDEKNKLAGIAIGANKTVVTDSLTSNSPTDALSAKQGKLLNDSISKITTDIGELGGGDMMKAMYDKDGDGKIDTANDAEKLGGELPSHYATADHVHDNATADKAGFLSKEDFTKLSGIAENANNYTLPKATDTVLGGIKVGENLSISEDGILSADAQHIDVDDALNGESVNPVQNKVVTEALDGKAASDHVHDVASATANGFMSKEDFEKLGGIEAEANKYIHPTTHAAAMITEDATHRFTTDEEKAAWNGKVNSSVLGQANGVATLDESGLIPSSQLPSYVDDVIEGYADITTGTTTDEDGFTTTTVTVDGFYSDEAHETAIVGESGKIYVDVKTNLSYRWGGSVFVQITSSDCRAMTNAEIDAIIATTV